MFYECVWSHWAKLTSGEDLPLGKDLILHYKFESVGVKKSYHRRCNTDIQVTHAHYLVGPFTQPNVSGVHRYKQYITHELLIYPQECPRLLKAN